MQTPVDETRFAREKDISLLYCDVNLYSRHYDFLIAVIYTRSKIAVVSYARYCRYRSTLKRLESVADDWLRNTLIEALGGFTSSGPDTRVMFCKVNCD